jgi:serine phosphatase RsbU (regulator of sigma subunit)
MSHDYLNTQWRILVIDDSRLNRAVIKKVLTGINMIVDEAVDGAQGLEILSKSKYDLVMVDIIMPNLDGFGFLSKFKESSRKDFIPVILMTGTEDLNSKIKGLRIGADDFLLKPLNEKELVARVISLLRLKSVYTELLDKNTQIKKELEVAKRIQQFIIPKDFSDIEYPVISGYYLPIEDIGGDFFDCYRFSNNDLGFLIADVTGHGIPAALIMTMSKMLFSIYAPSYSSTKELLSVVNSNIRGLLLDTQYITTFYVIYDREFNRIRFTNAGHTWALYYRASKNKIMALDTKGFFIGISDYTDFEEKEITVEDGDRLLLYTDGVTEIKDGAGKHFGENRLAKCIINNHHLSGNKFCESLIRELDKFTPVTKRNDDIAFLYIEF